MADLIQPQTFTDGRIISVLRGDMIKGGLKKIALLRYLPTLNQNHFAYAGTIYGSGGWAVAEACQELGFKSTAFIARSKHIPRWINDIKKTGTTLYWCDPLPVDHIHQNITDQYPDLCNLPLGFDTPDFIQIMANVLRGLCPTPPPEIWLPSLSGVLARAACTAFPDTRIHAVSAAKHHGDCGRATLHYAPEKFHQPARNPPPYPACPYSCAKIWQFAEKEAVSGALVVNIGY